MEYAEKNDHLKDDSPENIKEVKKELKAENKKEPEKKSPPAVESEEEQKADNDTGVVSEEALPQSEMPKTELSEGEKSKEKSEKTKQASEEKAKSTEDVPDSLADKQPGVAGSEADHKKAEIPSEENAAEAVSELPVAAKKPKAGKTPVEEISEKTSKEKSPVTDPEASKQGAVKVEHHETHEEEEKVNFSLLSLSDLVKVFDDLISNKPYEKIRNSVDEIQELYFSAHEKELAEKKQKFIEEGGLEQDFKPAEDPVNQQMNDLLEKYKILKSDHNKQLEEIKEVNLATKQEILEEFRLLMEGQEGFDNTFRKFKQLQTRWFEVGIIPKQNVKDLWNSYNYFVDKFNDYVKINRELRALDLKKNLDMKIKLCEKAEVLAADKNVNNSFKALQTLHAQWKEIGPIPREDKDAVWERFKAATSVINKAHQNFQTDLKDSLVANLEMKVKLCEKAEEIAGKDFSEHREWTEHTKILLDIQKEWKTIGYAPKKDNNLIYARFRKACDVFFDKKAAFYSKTLEHQKENLDKKREIVLAAEELKESTDWKSTTDKLIELQKKWKTIGPVPRKDADKLWRRFRAACDQFFSSKSDFFGGKNESYDDNLKAKEELIAEMSVYKTGPDKKSILKDIEKFQERYNAIGFVPNDAKDRIRDAFRDAQNAIISKLDVDDSDKSLIRFRIKMTSMLGNPKGENKMHFEREKMMTRLQQLRSDIGVWENNLGFFKHTKSAESMLDEFHEKIEDAKARIIDLEKKIRFIDDLEDS